MKKGLLFCFLILSNLVAFGQKADIIESSLIQGKALVKDSTSLRVFIEAEFADIPLEKARKEFSENFRISWVVYPDYGVKDRLASGAFTTAENNFFGDGNSVYSVFDIQSNKIKGAGIIFAEVVNLLSGKKELLDIPFDTQSTRLDNRLAAFNTNIDVLSFKKYFQKNETINLKTANNSNQNLFLVRYKHEFEAAMPPTAITNRSVPRTLKIDSVGRVSTNQPFVLPTEGLYFITTDTSRMLSGLFLLCVDERFPRLTRPEKLVKPLVYLSSNQEINEIINTTSPKAAIDDFFLKVTSGNPIVAKQSIKSYYKRVATANKLFSTYKEGWKTDRGMVYIILGPPSTVQRNRERETWVYQQTKNFSEITFTFNRKTNQFTENHYELIRYPEYQSYWYPTVEAWRIGSIIAE